MECLEPVLQLEGCLRSTSKEKGIRVSEYFLDFDKLRHVDRFFRILDKNFGISPNDEQRKLLVEKYGDGSFINWRKFVDCIDPQINEKDVSTFPQVQVDKFMREQCIYKKGGLLSEYEAFRPVLSRINQFIKTKGIDLHQCYKDFDSLNSGKINESQFYRNFPGPPDISDAEICALAKRYSIPNCPNKVDYRRFADDIAELNSAEEIAKRGDCTKTECKGLQNSHKTKIEAPTLHQIIERIGFTVYRRGIRVHDFFKDFDPLRHDEVTENQFKLALDRALGRELQPTDVQLLANFYRSRKNQGMISYRQFCREVDFYFHETDLEKRPLVQPLMPNLKMFSQPLALLNEDERMKVAETIARLREKVRRERIPTYQYFHDYDMGTALSRKITSSQLARLLHFLKLEVSSEECRLLSLKFADPTTGYIKYAELCEAIDPFYKASATETEAPEDPSFPQPKAETLKPPPRARWETLTIPQTKSDGDEVPTDLLMARIRHLVLVNRIQLSRFFEAFDPLLSGSISRSQFERALSIAAITRIGLHDLTPVQVDKLADAYVWHRDPCRVDWRRFVHDVDVVFTIPEIEQNPRIHVLPSSTYLLPIPGTGKWDSATDEMKDSCERGMQHLRRNILERRVDMKPEFKAFAKVNRSHVNEHNLKQIMSSLKFHIPDDQIDAIRAKYTDDEGFNYCRFLQDLDPPTQESVHYEYQDRITRIREAFGRREKLEQNSTVIQDVEGILDFIKREVYHYRIRVAEWLRDYDPLRHGRISGQKFRRALSLLPIPLKEAELNCIEKYFRTKDGNEVRWRDFCEEIERIFVTPHLEKDPLKEVEVYKVEPAVSRNFLSTEVAEAADRAMLKISKTVRARRTQLTQWFSDFDKAHRMTLSESQFQRVLSNLGVVTDLSKKEWDALFARYRHPVGLIDDVDYLAFSDDIFKLAGMEYRTP